MDSFRPRDEEPAKVCISGTYSPEFHGKLFQGLHRLAMQLYRKRILRSFLSYLQIQHGGGRSHLETIMVNQVSRTFSVPNWVKLRYHLKSVGRPKKRKQPGVGGLSKFHKDLIVGREAEWQATQASWWNWDGGSTIYFWRWPCYHRLSVRDGTKAFIHWNKLPMYPKPQQLSKDKVTREQIKAKVNGVRSRGYINTGGVKSTTGFFYVPKGDSDIRLVYDATKCGLNAALWTPNFFLPTSDSILCNADDETWFGDIDLGEMFLNCWLDEELCPYAGVDVSLLGDRVKLTDSSVEFLEGKGEKKLWE